MAESKGRSGEDDSHATAEGDHGGEEVEVSNSGTLFEKVWEVCARIAEEEGVALYDIDVPGGKGGKGVVRVYITRPSQVGVDGGAGVVERRSGISFEDCVRVTRRILDSDEQRGFIPDTCELEVSSPGINRRLRMGEHFTGAVGERVRIKFRNSEGKHEVVTGILKEFSDGVMKVESESGKKSFGVCLESVKEARVDFRF